MAVLPKKYSKRGPVSPEDYIDYMSERIEFYAQSTDRKILELERSKTALEERNKALGREVESLKKELTELKETLISGGLYGN
jgi:predicted nuclease with TOPRIM domain